MALLTNINGKLTVDSTGSVSFNRIGTSTTTGFTFPALDGSANQILKTNGSGILSWVDDEDNDVVTKIIGGTNITVSPATGIGDVTVNADLAGTVTGSGAAGRVAYWTSASNISSDGAFRFDGTNVAIGGAIVASRKLAIYNTNADNELEFIGADYTNIYSNTDSTMAVEVIGDGALRLATKGGNLTIVTGGSSTFSGNVGIGITPSASFSGLEVLQLGKGMTIFGNTNDDRATMAANLIVNTGTAFEYVMDGLAGRFSIEDGNMVWGTAPTGLAGGVATVTTRMTLLNTGNVGIGVTGPTQPLEILAAGGYDKSSSGGQTTNGILIKGGATAGDQNTTGGIGFSFGTGTAGISGYQNGSDQDRVGLSFYTHGSGTGSGASQETMRIKSGGEVGIGTTSPGEYGPATGTVKLDVKSGDIIRSGFNNPANSWIGFTSLPGYAANSYPSVTSKSSIHFANNDKYCAFLEGTDTYFGVLNSALNTTVFFATGSQNSYLGGSGNFGVGIIGPLAKLHVVGGTIMTGGWGRSIFLEDSYPATVYGSNATKYAACAYDHSTDVMRWYTGATTSDATQSANLRMSLQAGRLGIGNDTPTYQLDVLGSGGNGGIIHVKNTDAVQYPRLAIQSDVKGYHIGVGGSGAGAGYANNLYFYDNNVAAIRMVIDTSGQIQFPRTGQPPITNSLYGNIVLDSNAVTNYQRIRFDVGTTAYWGLTRLNTGNFAITGGSTWNDHAFELQYATQHVQINETIGQRRLNVYDATDAWIRLYCGSVADWIFGSNGSDHAFKWYNQSSNGGAGYKMGLATSGTLTVSADVIAYGSPSDKRLKENIKPIESALDKVIKLQGVTFDWKEKGITNLKEDIGFIAQDVQKVIPELVRENEDGMLSMRHQGIAPILLEAIKELKAEIEELKLNKCNCNK